MRDAHQTGPSRRTALLGAGAFLAMAGKSPKATPRVLFVCLHGTVKSPIAREILRNRAKARGVAVLARSRGITPEEGASPAVAAALVRDHIMVRRDRLQRLTETDGSWADIIVFFDPLPFKFAGKDLRDWTATPSVNQRYADALAAIRTQIEALLDELVQQRRARA